MQSHSELVTLVGRVPQAIKDDGESLELAVQVGEIAKTFIADLEARQNIPSSSLQPHLVQAWSIIATYFSPSSPTSHSGFAGETSVLPLAISLARLCRNVLVEVEENKDLIWACEPSIREVGYFITNSFRIADPAFLPLQRAIFQVLSNLLAPIHSPVDSRLWESLLSGRRKDELLHRGLDSKDPGVCMGVLMIILHSLEDSPTSLRLLISDPGARLLQRISDKMTGWHELPEQGGLEERCFDLGWKVFEQVFLGGVQGEVYALIGSPGEPISPTQTLLLKLLDAHLSSPSTSPSPSPNPNRFLLPTLHSLSCSLLTSISTSGTVTDDPVLAKVFEGLMLVLGVLRGLMEGEVERERQGEEVLVGGGEVRRAVREARGEGGGGVVEVVVELLAKLDKFVPRIKPFRSPAPSPSASISPVAPADTLTASQLQPFAYLKRDLIQFLGVVVYADRESQDRVRLCGGVEVVLNYCVGDELNPYIREHALFTVRNLMMGNPENQAVIGKMDPLGVVDEVTGELREMPERMGGKK